MMVSRNLLALALSTVAVGFAPFCVARTSGFPITNANDAITVAKKVCMKYGQALLDEDMNKTPIREAMPTLKWSATLDRDQWHVDTMPSVVAGTNDHLLLVDIPVEGPVPRECSQAGYDLLGVPPPKPPRGRCEPSDISGPDAQELASDVVEPPGRGVWLEVSRPMSEKDAWVVSVHNRDGDAWRFKVFKRTANVLNLKTGEFFTSLPSKAQFVEHHCLDKP